MDARGEEVQGVGRSFLLSDAGTPAAPVHAGAEERGRNMQKETMPATGPKAVGKSTVACLMLALFVAALDSTVVATAMPTVAAALGGEALYAWPMTAYLVASTVSTLLCGGLAFSFGLRRVYVVGLALFAASSALCAAAPTIEALAALRLIQGIGGGVLEAGVFIAAAMMLAPRDRGPTWESPPPCTESRASWAPSSTARSHRVCPGTSSLSSTFPLRSSSWPCRGAASRGGRPGPRGAASTSRGALSPRCAS